MPSRRALLEITEMLAPGASARVALVFDDPPAYARKYRQALEDRSLSRPKPWVALVDALAEQGALASLDWKTGFPELRAAVDGLLGKRLKWTDRFEGRSTLELLEIVGERLLREEGVALVHFDIDADESELALVPKSKLARLERIAEVLEVFTGSDLRKYEAERERQEKKARAKASRDPLRQRQFIHADGRVFVYWGVPRNDAGKRTFSWVFMTTRLGDDWTKAEHTSKRGEPPKVPRGFVEVEREEWMARDKKAKRRG